MPRYIRLREWGVCQDTVRSPTDALLALADHSLLRYDHRVRTDDHGFIVSGGNVSPGSPRVLVLGDSVLENLFVDASKRMCARLEAIFASRGGHPVQVLNSGMTGATTLHLLT